MIETVRTLTLLQRRADVTHEQFVEHWQVLHRPLVLALPGLLSYVQTEVTGPLSSELATSGIEPDGIAELTFASREARRAAYASRAGRALLADGPLFVGASQSLAVGARVTAAG